MSLPTPEQIAYMIEHADDDLRNNVVVCVSICAFLAVGFVATRLYARWLHGNTLLLADYLIVFALCLYIPFCVTLGLCTQSGLGKHVLYVTDARLLQIILAFYQRIFPQRWFRWSLLGVAVFMGAWMFTTVLAISFQCIPFEFNWDQTIPGGHCINIGQLALVTSVLNVLTDVAILIMPLPLVWKLNVTHQRKWGLIFLFALGGGACVVGITRAGYIGDLNATADPTWDNIPAAYLSAVEVLAGFLVACIPSYPVLVRRAMGKGSTAGSKPSKQSGPSSGPTPGGTGRSGDSRRLRPVMSWNRITNVDDIELSTTQDPNHRWEALSEEKDGYYRDGDQASTRALKEAPGVAL